MAAAIVFSKIQEPQLSIAIDRWQAPDLLNHASGQ
jgi:hypothetical protein